MRVGCMMWRIGDILEFDEQVDWLRQHDFAGVAFWTCAGQPGAWQGFDLAGATAADVSRLRTQLEGFASIDLHAATPLPAVPEAPGERDKALDELLSTIDLAGQIGAQTVTLHIEGAGDLAAAQRDALIQALRYLNGAAQTASVRIGLELTHSYELAMQDDTPQIGFTLDVGHVSFHDGAGYRDFGSIAGLIAHLGERLFHVHAHDYDGVHDHIPIGAGNIDWPPTIEALKRTGYDGVLCLELNPNRASPDDILESRNRLEKLIRGL